MKTFKLIQGQPLTEAMNLRTTEALMDHIIKRAGELGISRNEYLNRLLQQDKQLLITEKKTA